VTNASDSVDTALKNFKWGKQAMGSVVLLLSADNRQPIAGEFVVRGKLEAKEWRLEAAKLWSEADEQATLVIKTPKAEIFSFPEGGLWSDIVDGSELDAAVWAVSEGGQQEQVPAADYDEWGIGEFSARMVCQLSKQSSQAKGVLIKYHVPVFPQARAVVVKEGLHAKLGSLPGLKLAEGEFPLGPSPSRAWRCPLVPLTQPGMPYERLAVAPATDQLRVAIAAIMQKATAPELCKSAATLTPKWEKLRQNPGEAALKPPQLASQEPARVRR
jgi:hypothetical protein